MSILTLQPKLTLKNATDLVEYKYTDVKNTEEDVGSFNKFFNASKNKGRN